MIGKAGARGTEARRAAQALWDRNKKRDTEALTDREKARQAEAAKTARLRELRLAKEAADREAAGPKTARARRKPARQET